MNILDIPFNTFLGLQTEQRNDRNVLSLDPQAVHRNHLGDVHASVIFAVAEAASGHFLLSIDELPAEETLALLRKSEVKYRRPVKGPFYCTTSVADDAVSKLLAQLATRGRAGIAITTHVFNETDELSFEGTFAWFLSRQK